MTPNPNNRRAQKRVDDREVSVIYQWNCRSIRDKDKELIMHMGGQDRQRQPVVIALQETRGKPRLPGYITYTDPSEISTAILVRNTVTATQHITAQHGCEHTLIEIHARDIGSARNMFILNVYCRPGARHYYNFDVIVREAKQLAKDRPLLVLGDFNAPHPMWGYKMASKRGKALTQAMEKHDLTLLNEPGVPTRSGNSVTNDTTPDLTWMAGTLEAEWRCDDVDLGSDHKIISIEVHGPQYRAELGKARITDWDKMRKYTREGNDAAEETGADVEHSLQQYEEWAKKQQETLRKFTQEITTTTDTPFVDARLSNMWAARHSLTRRWKRQRRNRKLARRIALLNKQISEYAAKLCRENWHKMCEGLQGQLSAGKTWKLLRHLIDPAQSKTATNRNLTKVLNTFDGNESKLFRALKKRYLQTEKGVHPIPEEYEGPENGELDRPFTMAELWSAIDESNKKSAPGADTITYKLLSNMCGKTASELLRYINNAWETSKLPHKWKEAEIRFIPKPGKPPSVDNLRPISLTSCVGKVMERMVLQRLQGYLEDTGQIPATMFGFRKHLGTQDVMVQLHELVVKQATKNGPRAILALDLKGAFDNVTHASVLRNLNKTGCGRRTFKYIQDFLTDRTATIAISGTKSDPITLGERGTPQGSVISPLLFNLALLPLPRLLEQIEGIDHAFYADDITVWTTRAGSEGWMEETLQQAATTVHEYAKSCGLSCAPQKSELLLVQPGVNNNTRCRITVQIDGVEVKPTQQCRILGLMLRNDGKADAAIAKVRTTTEQVLGMLRRVANRNRGIKEDDAIRLVRAFVISRITYSAPYLQMTGAQREALNVLIRKAMKQALGLPIYSSTKCLYEMGVHNTVDELVEAHLSSQRIRLSQTEHGRRVLQKLGWTVEPTLTTSKLPDKWREALTSKPLPRNMAPGVDDDRRNARTTALARRLGGNSRVLYADASLQKGSDRAAAVVTTRDRLVVSASTRTRESTTAEEVAIALALVQPEVEVVVTDSKKAYSSYRRGSISSSALAIVNKKEPPGRAVELVWTPAHSSLVGNTIADYHAREMTRRAHEESSGGEDDPIPVTSYTDITQMYRENRCTLPEPHRSLTRKEQTILRRIQAGSLVHPTMLHKMFPNRYDDTCPFCKQERGTLRHVIAECTSLKTPIPQIPPPSSPTSPNPSPKERWEILRSSPTVSTHIALVARGMEVLEAYGPRE